MKLKRLAAALAFGLSIGPAMGEDLLTIYRDALVSDPVYQAQRAQRQATIEKLPQARAGYLPFVSAQASYFKNYNQRDGTDDLDYNTRNGNVSLSQPIIRVQNWIAIGQAEKVVLQADATLAAANQDLILRAAQAYFDVLLAQDNVALSQSQKTAFSEQLAQAKRNFEVGTATIVDTLEAQARYDQTLATEIRDINDLEVKRRALQQLVGKVVPGLVPLKEPLALVPPQPNDIEAWVTQASESSLTVIVAKAGNEIARKEVDRAQAGHLPTLDFSADYNVNRNPASTLGQLATGVSPTSKSGSVGIVLGIPIFEGGLTQSRVREAVALRDRADQDLENAQRSTAQNVRQSFLFVTNGIAGVQALERALASTQSQLDSTILGRDVGVRTSVDVLNAQQQVIQTRRDLQQVRYGYLMFTLRLKAATGTLTEADLEAVNRTLGRS
ncbi:TolC family outer membrane protein [Usitatibacter palustris]|uniref:Outer membrane protein TolC n=1 Tax=Usitatibacter palustris TaxID=2732487 RepID=A0A6M4H3J0_9PROT|nr:TolC family outer membrane protein [Usitatibacter palustris]QJR13273.1 Outer membrane protein TolC [Usitatibacter palustris]